MSRAAGLEMQAAFTRKVEGRLIHDNKHGLTKRPGVADVALLRLTEHKRTNKLLETISDTLRFAAGLPPIAPEDAVSDSASSLDHDEDDEDDDDDDNDGEGPAPRGGSDSGHNSESSSSDGRGDDGDVFMGEGDDQLVVSTSVTCRRARFTVAAKRSFVALNDVRVACR